jgi:hypothetical protein
LAAVSPPPAKMVNSAFRPMAENAPSAASVVLDEAWAKRSFISRRRLTPEVPISRTYSSGGKAKPGSPAYSDNIRS